MRIIVLGSSGRSASISSSNLHAHAHSLKPSVSFGSQSQQRSGYGEDVRSPLGKSGRAQVFGILSSLSVESFWGNRTGIRFK